MFCLLTSIGGSATPLKEVKILDVVPEQNGVKLTLRSKTGDKNSYFYVHLKKSDPSAFDLLARVAMRLQRKETTLNLNVISFSEYPSGSHYPADAVTVTD